MFGELPHPFNYPRLLGLWSPGFSLNFLITFVEVIEPRCLSHTTFCRTPPVATSRLHSAFLLLHAPSSAKGPQRRLILYARYVPSPITHLLTYLQVEKFVEEECIPADQVYLRQLGETTKERFSAHPSIIEDMKKRARELGLWNMFLPKAHFKEGAGFSNLEYGLMAEYLGKSRIASEVLAPTTAQLDTMLTASRLPTALLPTLATWRSLPSTALRHRRGSGWILCWRARSDLPS